MAIYCVVTHVMYVNENKEVFGPAHDIYNFLKKKRKSVYFIKHALLGGVRSSVNTIEQKEIGLLHNQNLLIRSIEHIWLNFLSGMKQKEKVNYIGIDPINSVAGVLLKLFNKTEKNIYFTVDYADQRFKNVLLNSIYHWLDMVCIRYADEVWSVSERIRNKRREQGVPIEINKLLPNSPVFNKSKVRENNNKDLIIVSNLTKSLNMLPILDVIKKLVNKGYDIHLNIIGAGPEERYFKRLVSKEKLDKDIFFLGQLDHEKVLDKISKSYLGFALYTNENSWNIYGDSMKTREYMAYGIPVIMNDIPSTADDVIKYRSGLVVHEINSDKIISFIEKCILDKHYYNALRKNAIIMAQENDKSKILEDLLLNRKK